MSGDEQEPLDPLLTSLFDAERRRGGPPPDTRDRVRHRLTASLGPAAGNAADDRPRDGATTTHAFGGLTGRAIPILGALVVGGALGAASVSTLSSPRIVYVDRVIATPVRAPTDPSAEPPVTTGAPAASPSPVIQTANPGRDDTLAKERAMLDVARSALSLGEAARALDVVERHAREFPRGKMSEEREALGVQSLVKLGRRDAAAIRGAAFRRQYPSSVLAPVIEAALAADANEDGGE